MRYPKAIPVALVCGLMLAIALPAAAHHGWSWTESGFFELRGTVRDVYVGNPHATIELEVEGEVWAVDLAPPARTISAGFDENTVSEGDEISVIGNRSQDESERRMKAVRVVVGGTNYDVYPGRAADI